MIMGKSNQKFPELPPKTVNRTDKPIPAIPNQTALFAFSWLLKPPNDNINNTLAEIYAADTNPYSIGMSSN